MAGGNIPRWLAVLSNRVLPPIFFMSLALFLFYISGNYESFLNLELRIAGTFSGLVTIATLIT